MYAIIATGGKQYKVSEGDVIRVEKLDVEAGNTVTFDQVIAVSDNGLKVGEAVANATVSGTVMYIFGSNNEDFRSKSPYPLNALEGSSSCQNLSYPL